MVEFGLVQGKLFLMGVVVGEVVARLNLAVRNLLVEVRLPVTRRVEALLV